MELNLNILKMASQLAAHSSARQVVITENIAQADTPGYRARDIADFETTMQAASQPFQARATRPGHLDMSDGAGNYEVREISVFGAESPNGNTVSLEDQIMRAADVRANHDLALGVYQKSMEIMRTAVGRGR